MGEGIVHRVQDGGRGRDRDAPGLTEAQRSNSIAAMVYFSPCWLSALAWLACEVKPPSSHSCISFNSARFWLSVAQRTIKSINETWENPFGILSHLYIS